MNASRIASIVAIIAGTIFTLAATLASYANSQFGTVEARFANDDWDFWAFTVWEPLQPFLWVTGVAFVVAVVVAVATRQDRAPKPRPTKVPW